MLDYINVSFENYILDKKTKREKQTKCMLDFYVSLKRTFYELEDEKKKMIEKDTISTEEKREMISIYNRETLRISDEMEKVKKELRRKKYTVRAMLEKMSLDKAIDI